MPSGKLWTPGGDVMVNKETESLSRGEIIILSKMHEIAHHRRMAVTCMDCGQSFTGQNNDSSKVLAIACACRELRFDGR